MKNRFKENQGRFINLPIKNPTQTQYLRFLESPGKMQKSAFIRNKDKFKSDSDKILKTRYTELFKEGL